MIRDLLEGNIKQEDVLHYYNATITYESLPKGIKGFVFSYRGINNIIIKCGMSRHLSKKIILHELAHIELNHLNQVNKDLIAFYIAGYEDEADYYIDEIMKNLK